jgi:hypothetical protein
MNSKDLILINYIMRNYFGTPSGGNTTFRMASIKLSLRK